MKLIFLLFIFLLPLVCISQTWSEFKTKSESYYLKGKIDSAILNSENALSLAEKEFGKLDSNYATTLHDLSFLYFASGNYKKGEPTILEAMKIREKLFTKNSPYYASSLREYAKVIRSKMNFTECIKLQEEALTIFISVFGEDSKECIRTNSNIAFTSYSSGDYNKAIRLYKYCNKMQKNNANFSTKEKADNLNNLATIYNITGNHGLAEPLFLELLELYKAIGENHPDYATTLNNIGNFYSRLGDSEKSLQYYLQSKEIREKTIGKTHKDYAATLNSLASHYVETKEYEEAEKYFTEALSILKNSVGEKNATYTSALNNMGEFYKNIGRFEDSEKLLKEAMNLRASSIGTSHPDYANSLYNLGGLYAKTKEYEKAEPLFLKAIKIYDSLSLQASKNYIPFISGIARLYTLTNRNLEASKFYRLAADISFNGILAQFSFMSEKEKEKYLSTVKKKFDEFNAFAFLAKKEIPTITGEAFNNVLKTKGILLKSTHALKNSIETSNDTLLKKEYEEWNSMNKKINSLKNTPIDKRKDDLTKLEETANALEKKIIQKSNYLTELASLKNADWKVIQNNLKSDEAAIEFTHFPIGKDSILYCALIIRKNFVNPEMIPLFEEKQIFKLLDSIQKEDQLKINAIYGTRKQKKNILYNIIWKPLEIYLKKCKTIYISPTGLLHTISYSAIYDDKSKLLSDKYNVSVINSANDLKNQSELVLNSNSRATLVGGVKYSDDKSTEETWNYLAGTFTEISIIDSLLKTNDCNIEFLSDTTASERHFKTAAENSELVHLSTHGFYFPDPDLKKNEQNAIMVGKINFRGGNKLTTSIFTSNKDPLLRSGLILTHANETWSGTEYEEDQNGILTASEIALMNLSQLQLAVLSACETGLGDITANEGVYGLQRAFKMAGTKNIIMSLWKVPDLETSEFMSYFYTDLIKTENIETSFKLAQKKMKKKYDPFFWGAFVLIK